MKNSITRFVILAQSRDHALDNKALSSFLGAFGFVVFKYLLFAFFGLITAANFRRFGFFQHSECSF